MDKIKDFNSKHTKKTPDLKAGDTVRVHTKIKEGNKERTQVFEGVVLKLQGGKDIGATVTVRKISYGIGVERTFLLHSPLVEKIQVMKRAKVRRANISYLKNLRGKSAKLKEKQFDALTVNVKEEDLAPADKIEVEKEIEKEEPVELSEDVMAQVETASTEDIAEAEEKEESTEPKVEDEAALPEEEVTEGVEKAEKDLEQGKVSKEELAEKNVEDTDQEEEAENGEK